jgi:hypothetical protein
MTRSSIVVGVSVVVGALVFGWTSNVWAKGKTDSLERSAKKACAAGDYAKGVEILADLYVRTDDPTFIFNQGRCYEQNHQWTRAIDRFREFQLKAPSRDQDAVVESEKHIAKCKTYLSEDEAKALAPPPGHGQATAVDPPASPPPELPKPPIEVVVAPPPPPPAPVAAHSVLPTVGIVVGSAGLASLVTAVVLNVKANSYADVGDESNLNAFKNGAWVCYGVGGAALATGIVLFALGHRGSEPKQSGVVVSPILAPGGTGLALRGGF